MRPWYRTYCAAAAERELRAREKGYPAQVDAGNITAEDVEADLAAWRAIVDLFKDGETQAALTWAELEHATGQGLLRREEALGHKPDDAALIARRDACWAIHEHISWQRSLIEGINRDLRKRAQRERVAA